MSYTPEQLQQIAKAAQLLDQMDYYQVLRIKPGSSAAEIKKSFFQQSRTWHPDKFFRKVPEETYQQVMSVYKRVSEAYSILRDEKVRPVYDQRIGGPERAKHLRYDRATEEARQRAQKPEDVAQTDAGKRYIKLVTQALGQRNWASAEINFKLALAMEAENKELKLMYLRAKRENQKKLTEEEEAFLAENGG